jgi:hypothetical protein
MALARCLANSTFCLHTCCTTFPCNARNLPFTICTWWCIEEKKTIGLCAFSVILFPFYVSISLSLYYLLSDNKTRGRSPCPNNVSTTFACQDWRAIPRLSARHELHCRCEREKGLKRNLPFLSTSKCNNGGVKKRSVVFIVVYGTIRFYHTSTFHTTRSFNQKFKFKCSISKMKQVTCSVAFST